jgi:hypothetical protein
MADDPNKLVVLTNASSAVEASVIVAALDAHGIRAITEGQLTAGFRAEAPGQARVLVAEADLDRARAQLAKTRRPSPSPAPAPKRSSVTPVRVTVALICVGLALFVLPSGAIHPFSVGAIVIYLLAGGCAIWLITQLVLAVLPSGR